MQFKRIIFCTFLFIHCSESKANDSAILLECKQNVSSLHVMVSMADDANDTYYLFIYNKNLRFKLKEDKYRLSIELDDNQMMKFLENLFHKGSLREDIIKDKKFAHDLQKQEYKNYLIFQFVHENGEHTMYVLLDKINRHQLKSILLLENENIDLFLDQF